MKRFVTCAVSLVLLSAALAPGPTGVVPSQRGGDPCGMTVCCCPHRCAMMQRKKLACRIQDSRRCGIRSSMPEASLSQFASSVFRIGLAPHSLADRHAKGTLMVSEVGSHFISAAHSPLDKPPALFS